MTKIRIDKKILYVCERLTFQLEMLACTFPYQVNILKVEMEKRSSYLRCDKSNWLVSSSHFSLTWPYKARVLLLIFVHTHFFLSGLIVEHKLNHQRDHHLSTLFFIDLWLTPLSIFIRRNFSVIVIVPKRTVK